MNKKNFIKKSVYKTGWIIIILVIGLLMHINTRAQVNIDPSKVILNDTLKFDTTATGLLKRIIQPIQFRGNRNKRENQRIYDFMIDRIKKGELKIDSNTVKQIMFQLDTIHSSTVLNKDSIDKIKVSIENIISNNDLTTKASKEVIDSLKTQMSAVVLENAANNSKEKREILKEANDFLKEIREVQYSRESGKTALDSLLKKDSTRVYIEKNLNPKIMIIGWHNSWLNENEFLRYNYNYLSAINLYGYELAPNGTTKKQKFIDDFAKKDGVIETAQKKGCEVHLTVYNRLPAEITKFLNDTIAQNTLTGELINLIIQNNLKGINLYFEDISVKDSKQFVQFAKHLRKKLKTVNNSIQFNITIPAKTDEARVANINAYNFDELIPIVDYFLILTDNLIGKNISIAQSSSPLFNSNKYRNYSIESTISFYNQLGIPVSKQIMTLSYSGVEWKVNDFTGTLKSKWKKDPTYADIIKNYSVNNENGLSITEGFDPDQVAAYLNIIGKNPSDLTQVWYEDSRSLFLKYNWALENKLGGVSIRGLGYDDGYSELWDVLGASLIKVDTFRVDSVSLIPPKQGEKVRFPILTYAWTGFKYQTFKEDLTWATVVRLKFDSIYIDSAGCKQSYYRYAQIDSIEKQESIKNYISKQIIWTDTTTFKEDPARFGEAFLKNKSNCYSLFARWTIYAWFFKWGGVIFAILTAILWLVSINSERYLRGPDNVRSITRNLPSAFILITLVFISFWLYFDPYFTSFGAGSEGGTENLILVYSIIAGVAFGWFVAYRYFKYKGS